MNLFLNYLIGIPRRIPPTEIQFLRSDLLNLVEFVNEHEHSNLFILEQQHPIGSGLKVTCRECGAEKKIDFDSVIQLARSELSSILEFTNEHAHSDLFVLEQFHGAIGNGTNATCKECGVKKDVTDLEIW